MLCRAAPTRTAARLCRVPSTTHAAPFTNSAKQQSARISQRPSPVSTSNALRCSPAARFIAHKSTFLARLNSTAAAGTNATAAGVADSEAQLTWNRFLALRKQRRRISLISSMACAVVCTMSGVVIIGSLDIESFGAQIYGFDTIFVLGLSTIAFGAVGWLVGPFIGNAVFNTWHRRLRQQIATVSSSS
jgi:import inner membrane translocase subunit TIM23